MSKIRTIQKSCPFTILPVVFWQSVRIAVAYSKDPVNMIAPSFLIITGADDPAEVKPFEIQQWSRLCNVTWKECVWWRWRHSSQKGSCQSKSACNHCRNFLLAPAKKTMRVVHPGTGTQDQIMWIFLPHMMSTKWLSAFIRQVARVPSTTIVNENVFCHINLRLFINI